MSGKDRLDSDVTLLARYSATESPRRGEGGARARSNGAITLVQRFNSALELSLHFHVLVPDGAFVRSCVRERWRRGERPRFVRLPAPSNEDVADVFAKRMTKMLHARAAAR